MSGASAEEKEGDDVRSGDAARASSPALDIVRIEPDGAGLVAGRATPNSDVEIVVENEVVGRARAGADGGFVAMILTTPHASAQRVVAREATPEAVASVGTPAPSPEYTAADGTTQHAPEDSAGDGATASEPVFIIGATEPGATPLVVQPSNEGVRLLQGPKRGPAKAVALDTISYDAAGRVVLSGRAPKGSEVRIYLNEASAGTVRTAEDGSWSFRPGDEVSPGTYRLRLDEVDPAGEVASRIETPFRREAIEPGDAPANAMIVQRGDSLWRIAETIYGEGLRYTLIYGANSDAISDPDLIYPGQIFGLPDAPAAE